MKIYQKGDIKKILNEREHPPKRTIVKLPCGHSSVEITKPRDTLFTCPVCMKRFALTWSFIDSHKRIKQI